MTNITLQTLLCTQFRLTRLQCIKMGTLLVMTTDMGKAKIFRPGTHMLYHAELDIRSNLEPWS